MKIVSLFLLGIFTFACSKEEALLMGDLKFVKDCSRSTLSFENPKSDQYESYISKAKKLKRLGLVGYKKGTHSFDNGNMVEYIYCEKTDLGRAVRDRLDNDSLRVPVSFEHQISSIESDIEERLGLSVLEYIQFVYETSGSVGGPGDTVYSENKDTIVILESLSKKGYINWAVEPDTFNGRESKSLHWYPTEKGLEILASLEKGS